MEPSCVAKVQGRPYGLRHLYGIIPRQIRKESYEYHCNSPTKKHGWWPPARCHCLRQYRRYRCEGRCFPGLKQSPNSCGIASLAEVRSLAMTVSSRMKSATRRGFTCNDTSWAVDSPPHIGYPSSVRAGPARRSPANPARSERKQR